jgi:hypothetical protein
MTVKYKVLKDFQLITEDKKIIVLKAKTIIENFTFKNKNETVRVPSDVIKNNADFFALFDWKEELQSFLRTNKIPQPAVITKKIVPFIESLIEDQETTIKEVIIEKEVIKEVVVEKPTIVEKQVLVEKPKIVEKEVVVEKTIKDDSLQIEFESRLKKFELKEQQLEKEILDNNKKELELINLEKKLNETKGDLETKTAEIKERENLVVSKENELDKREAYVKEKELNFSDYVSKSTLTERVFELKRTGTDITELFDKIILGL